MEDSNRFISLLSDYGFKITFADETNTLFLRKSLQALIQSPCEIKTIEFLRNEFPGITEDARGGLYDLFCQDEKGNSFIVEMQLGHYKHFIQRAKFYAFHRFNTLVERGKYKFDNLTPIYCIGFLAKNIFPESEQYYHFATLKNQIGEELDRQIVHVIVEIDKFDKGRTTIDSDLDKLIYIMKQSDTIQNSSQLPDFAEEDWIEQALKKVDKSKMTPEQRMFFEFAMAKKGSLLEMEEEENRIKEEETRKRVQEAESRTQEAESKRKEAESKRKEAESKRKEAESKRKEAESKRKEAESKKKAAESKLLTEKKQVAIKLKEKAMSVKDIAEVTGLSIPEIERL